MATSGQFPKAYVGDVPREGSDPLMVTVPFDNLGIGARKSAMPKGGANNIRGLDHVGGSAGGSSAKGVNHA
jgi:hypothetical protein